jgi:cbb3-type cytochrome oxidase maturation protein
MGILMFLIPLALLMSGLGVAAYIWACRAKQFDDLDSPPFTMLIDEEIKDEETTP